jgi:hypothetical protein
MLCDQNPERESKIRLGGRAGEWYQANSIVLASVEAATRQEFSNLCHPADLTADFQPFSRRSTAQKAVHLQVPFGTMQKGPGK